MNIELENEIRNKMSDGVYVEKLHYTSYGVYAEVTDELPANYWRVWFFHDGHMTYENFDDIAKRNNYVRHKRTEWRNRPDLRPQDQKHIVEMLFKYDEDTEEWSMRDEEEITPVYFGFGDKGFSIQAYEYKEFDYFAYVSMKVHAVDFDMHRNSGDLFETEAEILEAPVVQELRFTNKASVEVVIRQLEQILTVFDKMEEEDNG